MDFPINHGDFLYSYVSLPEGKFSNECHVFGCLNPRLVDCQRNQVTVKSHFFWPKWAERTSVRWWSVLRNPQENQSDTT